MIKINETSSSRLLQRKSKLSFDQFSIHLESTRHRQAEGIGGPHVDDELKPGGKLHRKDADLGAAQEVVDIAGTAASPTSDMNPRRLMLLTLACPDHATAKERRSRRSRGLIEIKDRPFSARSEAGS